MLTPNRGVGRSVPKVLDAKTLLSRSRIIPRLKGCQGTSTVSDNALKAFE